MKKNKGFTLIELLVVISIIAVLTAVALTNFFGARERALDAKKKIELSELKTALRLYFNNYSRYPAGAGSVIVGCGLDGALDCPSGCAAEFADWGSGGSCATATVYMKRLPDYNGSAAGGGFEYYQASAGDDFILRTQLDNASDPDITTGSTRCSEVCGNTSLGSPCPEPVGTPYLYLCAD